MPRREEIEVQKLLREGKVTPEEARKLLEAIEGVSGGSGEVPRRALAGKRRRAAARRSLEIKLDKTLTRPARAILGLVLGGGITVATLLVVLPLVGFAVGLALGLVVAILVGLALALPVLILGGSLGGVFGMPFLALKQKLALRRRRRTSIGRPQGFEASIDQLKHRALQQRLESKQRRSGDESSGGAGDS